MTTTTATRTRSSQVPARPWGAAALGAVTFGAAMTAGEVFDLNTGEPGVPPVRLGEVALYAGIVLGAVLLAGFLATRALGRGAQTLARTALGLAIGAVLTSVAFWSGWPLVLGAVAASLGLEYRRRVGSFAGTALAAVVLGTVAFVGAAVLCVTG
jgi:hypothetical protein